ncbi:MAG: amidohydrolase, partial [Thermoanaerobaculia bacterium]
KELIMKKAAALLALVLGISCASTDSGSLSSGSNATIALMGGRVFTADPSRPWAEAVAIQGDRIMAVGSVEEVRSWVDESTRIVPLEGRVVIPGINDAHVHAPWPTVPAARLEIPDQATLGQMLAMVREAAAHEPAGTWIIGSFPLGLLDGGITRADIDEVALDHPVQLDVLGGHASLLNTPALRLWGVEENVVDPPGGWYGRKEGRLDGWLYEHAFWAPQVRFANGMTNAELEDAIRNFESEALRYGITSVQTMSPVSATRVEYILSLRPSTLRWRVIDFRMAPFDPSPGSLPVKYILDGTPIERGGAMRQPYADAPGHRGRMNYSLEEIDAMVRDAAPGGRQLLVHVAGDAAAAAVLAAMQKYDDGSWPKRRVRLEHATGLSNDLLPEARRLGVVVVENPSHFMLPGVMAARFGPQRSMQFGRARTFYDGNIPFALGSDGPLNPFLNMMFVARHPGNPNETLSVEQALLAYTRGSAYAEFQANMKGAIAPGMLADLAVLSQDIFAVPLDQLPQTSSVMTIVGGKVVWEGMGAGD